MIKPPPKDISGLVFGNVLDDPLQARLEAVLGQQEASRLQLHIKKEKKACWGNFWQTGWVADCLYAFATI